MTRRLGFGATAFMLALCGCGGDYDKMQRDYDRQQRAEAYCTVHAWNPSAKHPFIKYNRCMRRHGGKPVTSAPN